MLTENQKKMVVEAIGNGSDWPRMTDDPQVNCAVDVAVCNAEPWEHITEEMQGWYTKEADWYKNNS